MALGQDIPVYDQKKTTTKNPPKTKTNKQKKINIKKTNQKTKHGIP